MTLSVLISGLGRIGAGADMNAPSDATPLSHLGAVLATNGLEVCGLVEPDEQRLAAIMQRLPELKSVRQFTELAQCEGLHADIVTLCGPVIIRPQEYHMALGMNPRLIILEKPVAPGLSEAQAMAMAVKPRETSVRVNFHRRFDAAHALLKLALPDAVPNSVVVRYSKGLYHFASHAVDLLLSWFGSVKIVRAHGPALKRGAVEGDQLISFDLLFKSGFTATFVAIPAQDYPVFEIDLYYPNRCFTLEQGGVRITKKAIEEGLVYPGYSLLGEGRPVSVPNRPVGGFAELYNAAHDHLALGTPLPGCTLEEALIGMDILNGAEISATTGNIFRPSTAAH